MPPDTNTAPQDAAPKVAPRPVVPCGDWTWPTVPAAAYMGDDRPRTFAGVTRRLLAAPPDAAFDVRYFEVETGGHTRFERHAHEHVVVALRGRGRLRLGDEWHRLAPGDVATVRGDVPHQLRSDEDAEEPFGFLCIVNRERDRPVPLEE